LAAARIAASGVLAAQNDIGASAKTRLVCSMRANPISAIPSRGTPPSRHRNHGICGPFRGIERKPRGTRANRCLGGIVAYLPKKFYLQISGSHLPQFAAAECRLRMIRPPKRSFHGCRVAPANDDVGAPFRSGSSLAPRFIADRRPSPASQLNLVKALIKAPSALLSC
jgi:hypothetical protein